MLKTPFQSKRTPPARLATYRRRQLLLPPLHLPNSRTSHLLSPPLFPNRARLKRARIRHPQPPILSHYALRSNRQRRTD